MVRAMLMETTNELSFMYGSEEGRIWKLPIFYSSNNLDIECRVLVVLCANITYTCYPVRWSVLHSIHWHNFVNTESESLWYSEYGESNGDGDCEWVIVHVRQWRRPCIYCQCSKLVHYCRCYQFRVRRNGVQGLFLETYVQQQRKLHDMVNFNS